MAGAIEFITRALVIPYCTWIRTDITRCVLFKLRPDNHQAEYNASMKELSHQQANLLLHDTCKTSTNFSFYQSFCTYCAFFITLSAALRALTTI